MTRRAYLNVSILPLEESAEEDWKIKRQVLLERKVNIATQIMHDIIEFHKRDATSGN